jgi:tetratricopeptide (TPR) repeat protein
MRPAVFPVKSKLGTICILRLEKGLETTLKSAQITRMSGGGIMQGHDARGLEMTGALGSTRDGYEKALAELQCYVGDPMRSIDDVLSEKPDFAMGHILRAYLPLVGTESLMLADARASHGKLSDLALNDREKRHAGALQAFLDGTWEIAMQRLEDLLVAYPRDALALQVAHLFDFLRGDNRNLRDRVARRLYAWTRADPGYHALLGMHAFGLEEMGEYDRAVENGREAVALNVKDGWAYHAVTHVREMQNRPEDGIAWLTANETGWAEGSFFAIHNWWHLALYHLELDHTDRVLALFDGPIRSTRSGGVNDLLDASALLWRLKLRDIDVGDRWQEVADSWARMVDHGYYAFNDVHALMSFIGAGRGDLIERQRAALKKTAAGRGSGAMMARDVGEPVADALIAFASGRYGEVVKRLEYLRPIAHRFGGSHAQRDLIDLTLIEAAKRAGQRQLVSALAGERSFARPRSSLARRYASWGSEAVPA